MKFFFLLTAFILLNIDSFAQKSDTAYLDVDFKETIKTKRVYYRVIDKNPNDGLVVVKDFYKNDQLQMTGVYKTLELEIKHGDFVWYYPNGNVQQMARFEDNVYKSFKEWNKKGKLIYSGTAPKFKADVYLYGTYKSLN